MTCNDCNGTGLEPRDPTSACRRCGGRGTHRKPRRARVASLALRFIEAGTIQELTPEQFGETTRCRRCRRARVLTSTLPRTCPLCGTQIAKVEV